MSNKSSIIAKFTTRKLLMSKVPPDSTEQMRLSALQSYKILDTIEEKDFDDLTSLASTICQVPIALISLVDEKRQWFKSHKGLSARETPIEQSFCAHAILSTDDMMIIEDARADTRFVNNPLVTGAPKITFYAGVPLTTSEGFSLGTLCVISPNKKQLSEDQKQALKVIAKQVMDKLELRRKNFQLEALNLSLNNAQTTSNMLLETLKVNHERMRSLVQQAPVAIIVFRGENLLIESVNPPMLTLLDKDNNILGKPLLEAIPELDQQPALEILKKVLHTGQPEFGDNISVQLKRNNKVETGYFNFSYSPLIEEGKVTGVIDMAVDVTRQVLAQKAAMDLNFQLENQNIELATANTSLEAAYIELQNTQSSLSVANGKLQESEKNLQTLADNISQLAWMADENGEPYWYNKRWIEYTGMDLVAMKSADWQSIHHPEHLERVFKKFGNDISNNRIWEDTFPIKGTDGNYKWFLSRAIPLKNEDGSGIRWFGTNTDITEWKEFDQRKDDFLGMVSHELKTPITTIKANLQLLERIQNAEAGSMSARLIDSSNRSISKINSLLDDLLNMRRFGEGQLTLEKTRFNVWSLLSLSCSHVRIEGKHELNLQGNDELEVFADEHRIDQVIVNFINNAVKYAPESKVIELSIVQEGSSVKISVKDFGPGIAKDQLPLVFDRYWRGSHLGQTYSGLGLGLYICAEIIKQHEGEIGVSSEFGTGATFWFTLPLEKEIARN